MPEQPSGTQTTTMSSGIKPSDSAPLALRPRDIQARIRAGETAEDVAASAHTTVEKIMVYAGPVLAEREHMAERAQKASVRRADSSAANRQLGEAVTAHLSTLEVDPESLDWDSWRRHDGRWVLTAGFSTPDVSGTARFVFDTAGNFVTLESDEARWLVGDLVVEPEPVRDDLRSVRERRLTPILDEPLPLETGPEPETPTVAETPVMRPPAEPEMTGPIEQTPRRNVAKKRGRASVPSWDEIMFGSHD